MAATSNGQDGLQLGCDPRYLYTPSTLSASSSSSSLYSSYAHSLNTSRPGMEVQNLGIGTCALYTGVSMQYTPIDACESAEEGACLSGFSAALESGNLKFVIYPKKMVMAIILYVIKGTQENLNMFDFLFLSIVLNNPFI